jgi:hypothetical protein
MTAQEILENYRTTIANLESALTSAATARLELAEAERQLSLFEAARLIQGIDGSNEAQRKANLLVALEADADYCVLRDAAGVRRERISDADVQSNILRERCRLLRLSLALSAPQGVLEVVA